MLRQKDVWMKLSLSCTVRFIVVSTAQLWKITQILSNFCSLMQPNIPLVQSGTDIMHSIDLKLVKSW